MGSFVELINDCGKIFLGSMGLMLIQSSVLIAILFGLDLLLRRRIRAVFRYCLWMLVLIKLVLPTTLAMPFSAGYWLANAIDRVESSRSDTPTQVAGESSSHSTEMPLDNPSLQSLAAPEDTGVSSTTSLLKSRYPPEAATANQRAGASVPNRESAADNTPPPPQEVVLPPDRTVALTWQAAVFCLWFVVCMGMGFLILQRTLLIQGLVRQSLPADEHLTALFESCRKRMLIRRNVELGVSSIIPTPAVYGLFRPTVLIPQRMLRRDFGAKELETVLIHELVHIQRCDLWVKLLQTILQVVYFYNPLLWLANANIRRVRELAVDEAVLVILGRPMSRIYPRTLIKVAGCVLDRPMHGLRLIGVIESNDLLTERINAMLHNPTPRSKKVGMIGLLTLFILGVFLLPMARAGLQTTPPDNTKEIAEIQMMRAEIESLQQLIQMKLGELRKKEAELGLIGHAPAAPPSDVPAAVPSDAPVMAGVAPPPDGSTMVFAAVPGAEHDGGPNEGALPKSVSDEVRKELQRILPGLLREILPQLLKEAAIEAARNTSTTDKSN